MPTKKLPTPTPLQSACIIEELVAAVNEERRIRKELERELGETVKFREYWRAEARRYKSMYESLLEVLWLERNKQEVK